jgi:uncharacterized damage-inducible protein DinB
VPRDAEAKKTAAALRALPAGQYDFRPDAGGRSLGELAWHLAEIDGYWGCGIERGAFEIGVRPPGIERPKTIEELAPGYERVHAESMRRIAKLTPADLDREVIFFTGKPMTIRNILRSALLHHQIHHRGQLSVLCRLAGGASPGAYGPNREDMAKFREKMAVTK